MTCPYCNDYWQGIGMAQQSALLQQLNAFNFWQGGNAFLGAQMAPVPFHKTKLQLAREYAADVRKRHPEMQVSRLKVNT